MDSDDGAAMSSGDDVGAAPGEGNADWDDDDAEFYVPAGRGAARRKRSGERGARRSRRGAAPSFVRGATETETTTGTEPRPDHAAAGASSRAGLGFSAGAPGPGALGAGGAAPGVVAGGKTNDEFRALLRGRQGGPSPPRGAPPPKKRLGSVNVARMGTWEKHTKGFGSKMLAKMGFKGRLGKEEDGVSRHVEVRVRPNAMGLGYGGFKEAAALSVNRQIERELGSGAGDGADASAGPGGESSGGAPRALSGIEAEVAVSEGWRRGGKKRPRVQYAVLGADRGGGEAARQASDIVDMRGPEAVVLRAADGVARAPGPAQGAAEARPALGADLLRRVALHMGVLQEKALAAERRQRDHKRRRSAEAEQRSRAEREERRLHAELDDLSALDALLEACEESAPAHPESPRDALRRRIAALAEARRRFPSQCAAFGVEAAAAPSLRAALDAIVSPPELLEDPAGGLTGLRQLWAPLSPGRAADALDAALAEHGGRLVDLALRGAGAAKDPAGGVRLVAALASLGGAFEAKARQTVDATLPPALTAAVEGWRLGDEPPLHEVVLPWAPVARDAVRQVLPAVRQRLARLLRAGGAAALSQHGVNAVAGFRGAFEASAMRNFCERAVLPPLAKALAGVDFAAEDQRPARDALRAALRWHAALPDGFAAALMDAEVLPAWLHALQGMLAAGAASPRAVAQWYEAWVALWKATPAVAGAQPVLRARREATRMMRRRAEGHATEPPRREVVRGGRRRLEAAIAAVSAPARRRGRPAAADYAAKAPPPPPVGLREALAEAALERGLHFFPAEGAVDGRQLYRLGAERLYFDAGAIMVERGGRFAPASVRELVGTP